uniref:Ribosomal protein L14 n=1 Tax=Bigelowiella natans TaxID=227086 RepID=E9NZX3_BIGNA|nr:ribosomal protein L14 [Bigelowiella natans]
MIKKETKMTVADNSDARLVLCIHANTKRARYKKTSLANFVKVTIKRKVSRRNNIKKRVNWCLIGATPRRIARLSGESIRFSKTKALLVDDKKKKSMGSLIKGVLPREVRAADASEVVSRARRLV